MTNVVTNKLLLATVFACYFSENTKLDFSTGFGLSKAATDWYAAIGISFRFATKRK